MLKVFFGDDRVKAQDAVQRELGANYEVLDGEDLTLADLPSIFRGSSLFDTGVRRILVKDVSANTIVWEKIADYADTSHQVIIWETKLDKRTAGYKALKAAKIEMQEFAAKTPPETKLVFGILETAFRDGEAAVRQVEQIELAQDPYMFFGLLVTQLLKRLDEGCNVAQTKRQVQELAKLDLQMKTTGVEPWLLVKSFLLRVGKL